MQSLLVPDLPGRTFPELRWVDVRTGQPSNRVIGEIVSVKPKRLTDDPGDAGRTRRGRWGPS